jgi:hypothetical protein
LITHSYSAIYYIYINNMIPFEEEKKQYILRKRKMRVQYTFRMNFNNYII